MKKFIKVFLVVVIFSTLTYAKIEVIIGDFKGNVVYGVGDKWLSIKKGQILKENEKVKTLANSYVLLILSDGTNVSLSENTELVIKELSNNIILNLNSGRIKSKVKPLQLGQKFEVRTPVSVASVRGTVFMKSYIDGQAELVVEEGKVVMGELATGNESGEITNFVEVNSSEKVIATEQGLGEKVVLTDEQLKEYNKFFELNVEIGSENVETGKKDSQEGLKEEVKNQLKEELLALKQELRDFIREAKSDNFYINEIVKQTKSNDFETARALVDAYGNLTRVEQTLSRPSADTVEFVNITKRNNYVYKGEFNYAELIENKPRVDILTFSIQFNQNLPQKINELPAFISSKGEDFYPKKFKFELSNGQDKFFGETTFEKVTKIENNKTETKLEPKTENWITNGNETYKIDVDYDESVKGKLPKGRESEGENKLSFWAETPVPVLDINNNSCILWTQSEAYVINNSGKVLDENFFNNSNLDPFSMLKEIALQSVVFVRRDDNGKPGSPFFNRNIDLVSTPDIVVAMVKTFAASAGNLKFSQEN